MKKVLTFPPQFSSASPLSSVAGGGRFQVQKTKLKNSGLWIFIFCLSLAAGPLSLAAAESLSDIKLIELQSPVKDRWGRDPFMRYNGRTSKEGLFKEDQIEDLKVNGIISNGKKAVAIINGGFYRKNEKVEDFLITEIGRDKILLEKNGKTFYLGIEKFAVERTQKGVKK